MIRSLICILGCLVLVAGFACNRPLGPKIDPARDQFYDMTRHIMTDEEIEIYRHLPDIESKNKFIREFWDKRDPDLSTEENEAYDEFMQRVQFAIRWFDEHQGEMRGWDTLRGRILLQLGFPDTRKTGNSLFLTDQFERRYSDYEIWYYREYGLKLLFVDKNGFGRFDFYGRYPSALTYAVSQSRHRMLGADSGGSEHRFRFDVDHRGGEIEITIPVKHLIFDEKDERLSARFSFTLFVYLDAKSQETIRKELDYSDNKTNVLEKKEIIFQIPFVPGEKGHYFIEVIGKNMQNGERYRTFLKIKP